MAIEKLTCGVSTPHDVFDSVNGLVDISNTLSPPTGFNWPLPYTINASKSGNGYYPEFSPSDFIDFDNDFSQVLYADVDNGDNSNDGLSWATAKKSIGACVDLAISSVIDTKIMVSSGVYYRQVSPSNGSSFTKNLNVNISINAVNGRVVTGPFETLAYTKTVGQNYVYETARSAAQRVYNPSIVTDGQLKEYKLVNSIVECDAEAGTWFTDDITVYVHSHNDAPVSDSNARVFLSSKNFGVTGANKLHLYGIDFQGGSTGALGYEDSLVVSQDCTFDYALSGKAVASYIAVDGVIGLGGLFVSFDSGSSYNSKDGFNIHESASGVGYSITSNCYGFNNGGVVSGTSSCNGLTNHDGGKSIDIGGVYLGSWGSNVAIVDIDTQIWCLGTVSGASGGDRVSISTGGFSCGVDVTCEAFLEHTEDKGTNVAVNSGAGTVYLRDHKGTGAKIGNISTFTR